MAKDKGKHSVTELNNMKKEELKQLVLNLMEKTSAEPSQGENSEEIVPLLREILQEVQKGNTEKEEMKKTIDQLKTENSKLSETLSMHQRYLEGLDAERRSNKVIAFNVPENPLKDGEFVARTDAEKVKIVFGKINHGDVTTTQIRRLGQQSDDKTRPIEITLTDRTLRQDILNDAKKLKELPEPFSKMYLRKDIHPAVRKEWKRLRDAEAAEKMRPENAGKNVHLDFKNRVLKIDDIIIDRHQAHFFAQRVQEQ